jgi:hypothetical protein
MSATVAQLGAAVYGTTQNAQNLSQPSCTVTNAEMPRASRGGSAAPVPQTCLDREFGVDYAVFLLGARQSAGRR